MEPWEGRAAHQPALLLPLAGFLQSLFHILREREIPERGRRGGERGKGVVKRREKDKKETRDRDEKGEVGMAWKASQGLEPQDANEASFHCESPQPTLPAFKVRGCRLVAMLTFGRCLIECLTHLMGQFSCLLWIFGTPIYFLSQASNPFTSPGGVDYYDMGVVLMDLRALYLWLNRPREITTGQEGKDKTNTNRRHRRQL